MKIALIIPYKNAAQWLPRCLDSIDGRFVIIAVNDHSTDESEQIALLYHSARHSKRTHYRLHYSEGVGAARNEGRNIARRLGADYVTFLDADDELAPDAFDQMIAAIKEAPDAPIIQLNHLVVKPDGSKWPRLPNRRGTYELSNLPKLWASSCNKLFKMEAVDGISFPNIQHGEDELFVLEVLAKARRIYNSERVALYYHNDNPNSLSKSTTLDDIIAEQVALLEFLDDHRDDKEICEAIRIRQSELWINPTYKRAIGGAK